MEAIYYGFSRKSGVYKIYNKLNGRIYIGSAKELKNRYSGHLNSLLKNKHSNKFLQNDFNKCGSENFVFEVIEQVDGEDRFVFEQLHIDKWFDKQDLCYNFKPNAIQKERSCFSLTPEETAQKISANSKKMWDSMYKVDKNKRLEKLHNSRTKESYEKVSKALTGIKRSKETNEKNRQHRIGKSTGSPSVETVLKLKLNEKRFSPFMITNVFTGESNYYTSFADLKIDIACSFMAFKKLLNNESIRHGRLKHYKVKIVDRKTFMNQKYNHNFIPITKKIKTLLKNKTTLELIEHFERNKRISKTLTKTVKQEKPKSKRVAWNKGRKCSEQEIEIMRRNHKIYCSGNPIWIEKQRKSHIGKKPSKETLVKKQFASKTKRPIKAINIKTKEELIFSSLKNASEVLDVRNSNIYRILAGKQRQAKNWIFVRLDI